MDESTRSIAKRRLEVGSMKRRREEEIRFRRRNDKKGKNGKRRIRRR